MESLVNYYDHTKNVDVCQKQESIQAHKSKAEKCLTAEKEANYYKALLQQYKERCRSLALCC